MNKRVVGLTGVLMQVFFVTLAVAQGHDCPGGWKVLPNYNPGQGAPCQILGLHSRHGVCQPGYAFETLCDDASKGRYKTCQGTRPCGNPQPPQKNDCTGWDYNYNQPCPPGFTNRDCKGGCER